MTYELHVWGPAFGLPSIDAACTSTIAYFKEAIPAKQWYLVIDYKPPNPLLNETFPALRAGGSWIFGYDAIIQRLNQDGYYVDGDRQRSQTPDGKVAEKHMLAAHVAANARSLLAAHLYTTNKNWTAVTRTTWTHILPTHANYTVVPDMLERARAVATAAGLSSGIEGEDELPPASNPAVQAQLQATGQIDTGSPSLLFARSRQTIQQALHARQSATRFRIEALLDDLLEPLDLAIAKGGIGSISSLDCVAYGYIAPLLLTDFPVAWIPQLLRERYPRIVDYIEHLGERFLPQGNIDTLKAMASPVVDSRIGSNFKKQAQSNQQLPFFLAEPPTYLICIGSLLRTLSFQIISPANQRRLLYDQELHRRVPIIIGTTLPLVGGFAYLTYRFVTLRTGPDHLFGRGRPRLAGLGAAGAALSVLGQNQMYPDQATMGFDGVDVVGLGGSGAIQR